MSDSKNWNKFPILLSLYIAQSIPMSFFSTVVPVIMRQENYSLESIGLIQLVKLPWIIKFLWAPIVDNHTSSIGSIKKWIIGSELFYALIILSVGFFSLQTDFLTIIGLIIIAFVASATQDIATDIFAIKILKNSERSLGNSMQSAGSFIGSLIGTGVLLLAYHYFGWKALLLLLSVFVIIAIIPLGFYRPTVAKEIVKKERIGFLEIFRFFLIKKSKRHALMLVFYYSGIIGTMAMLKPYMVDLGYNVKQIGFMSGIVGTAVASLAALLSGLIIKKIGIRISSLAYVVINILISVYFHSLTFSTPSTLQMYLAIMMIWGVYGLSTVAVYTRSMQMVREGREGTDFTTQIVITHLSSLLIAVFSGKIADAIQYRGLYKFEIVLGLITLVIVYLNFPLHKKSIENLTQDSDKL